MQLSVKEAARLLKVSETTVYRWIRTGSIPASQISDQVRLSKAELLEWASSRKIPVDPQMFSEENGSNGQGPRLSDVFRAGGVFHGIQGKDKATVLREVLNRLTLPEDMDRAFLCDIFLARESLGSTAIGDGIAIPHVRHPNVLQACTPMIALCFLETPIDFEAADGKPVRTLFMLFSPTVRLHLQVLSKLVFLLRNPDFAAALERRAQADELIAIIQRAETSLPTPKA